MKVLCRLGLHCYHWDGKSSRRERGGHNGYGFVRIWEMECCRCGKLHESRVTF